MGGSAPDQSPGGEAPPKEPVRLFQGDAVEILTREIEPGSIDMAYADPPYGNEQIWSGSAGTFSDKWSWNGQTAAGWAALREHSAVGADLMAAIARTPSAKAYLGFMAGLLLAVRRALKKTGTIWIQFDDTMGAEIRVLGDVVFGPDNQLGTIIWKRSTGSTTAKSFARVHDTIACFGRSRAARARLSRIGAAELVHGGWDGPFYVDGLLEDRLTATAAERVGYPTQKPVALISRFIRAASLVGDVVLDPTCGSGTTLVAAKAERRRAIGIDRSADAIATARERLFPPPPPQTDLFAGML